MKITHAASLALVLGINSAVAATPSASTCASLLSMQATYQNCQANGSTISQCVQNNLASQTPNSSGSATSQLQASSTAAQTLSQLDFQCQYFLAYGSQPPVSSTGPNSGGFGSSLKNMLGIHSNSPATQAPAQANNLSPNQSGQLSGTQSNSPSSNKSSSDDSKSNSINWF